MAERIFAICVAAAFGFLPYAVKGMPTFVAWIGILAAVAIGGLTFTPINPRLIAPTGFVIVSIVALVAASSWLYERYSETPNAFPDAIAKLAELGWTVKPSQNDILFEIANTSLPPMSESSAYFGRLNKSFKLHFQNVSSLDGLHYAANIPDCKSIEINAGEFTDISELRGFTHLTKLVIGQVPLNGVAVIDTSPLSSLVNLKELVLSMSRIRNVSFLRYLKKLKRLYLGQTLVTDISAISAIHSLEYVDIRGTRIDHLAPLSEQSDLSELSIGADQIPGLISLAGLTNLKKLTIIDQKNVDLLPIGLLVKLESLTIWGLPQLNLSPLRNLTNLHNLQLSGIGLGSITYVVDPEAIDGLQQLQKLTLGSLQVSDLSFLKGLKHLSELNLSAMPITSLMWLKNLKSLKTISLVDMPVVDISVLLELPNLTSLRLIRVPARADVISELQRRGVATSVY